MTPNLDTIYAGTEQHGVFKSNDRGENWHAVDEGWPGARLLSLAIDPTDPSILYAGTEDGIYMFQKLEHQLHLPTIARGW
ncbi:MAG: hypothetical protein U9R25_09310 [Chloroflexota bacterium]|nr:hypothetical protein [Chloroflexota bacterium]